MRETFSVVYDERPPDHLQATLHEHRLCDSRILTPRGTLGHEFLQLVVTKRNAQRDQHFVALLPFRIFARRFERIETRV